MYISILTLFPDMFSGPFDFSIIKRAQEKKLATIDLINIRDFATDSYRTVDDHPYGGGVGMIMKVDVIDAALESVKAKYEKMKNRKIILLDPKGKTYGQQQAREFSKLDHLVLICGHYEGVDQRVHNLVDASISIGNYVLTGGEIAALAIADSVTRLIPGVLKNETATVTESFTEDLLEAPQYTRPQTYKGMSIPKTLLSGDPKKIADWQRENSKKLT